MFKYVKVNEILTELDRRIDTCEDKDLGKLLFAKSLLELAEAEDVEPKLHSRYVEAKINGQSIYPDGQKMCEHCEQIMPSTWKKFPLFCFGCGASMDKKEGEV